MDKPISITAVVIMMGITLLVSAIINRLEIGWANSHYKYDCITVGTNHLDCRVVRK